MKEMTTRRWPDPKTRAVTKKPPREHPGAVFGLSVSQFLAIDGLQLAERFAGHADEDVYAAVSSLPRSVVVAGNRPRLTVADG